MKKRLMAILCAGAMVLGMSSFAFAEAETESAPDYENYLVMQGFDGENAWTVLLNANDATGTASIASSAEDVEALYGEVTFGDGSFSILDEEDGQEYAFNYEEHDNANLTFSNEDGSTTFDAVFVNPSIAEVINDYYWFAGADSEGDSLTIGISEDLDWIILGYVFADGSEDVFFGMEYDAETGIATDDDGDEYSISFDFSDDSGLFMSTDFEGEVIDMYFVNPGVFPEFQAE